MSDRIKIYVCAFKFFHKGVVTGDLSGNQEGYVALMMDADGRWRHSVESDSAVSTGVRLREILIDSHEDGDEAVSLLLSPPLDIEFHPGVQTMMIYRPLNPQELEKFILGFATSL